MKKITKVQITEVISESNSMAQAASKLKLAFNTFKRKAIQFNCFAPNQAGKGVTKNRPAIPLSEILEGKHPEYQTNKLKKRLLKERIFENICSNCDLENWNNLPLVMELDHIDGDSTNHKRNNLRLLCPNCHSQTETFRGKNKS